MVPRNACVETRVLQGSSQEVILIVVTLVSYYYHDKALILSEFLFMKTVREIEMTQYHEYVHINKLGYIETEY